MYVDYFELVNYEFVHNLTIKLIISNLLNMIYLEIILKFRILEMLCKMEKCRNQYTQQFCTIDEVFKLPLEKINDMFMVHHHFLEQTTYRHKILISLPLF